MYKPNIMFLSFCFVICCTFNLLTGHVRASSSASVFGPAGIRLEFDSHRLSWLKFVVFSSVIPGKFADS